MFNKFKRYTVFCAGTTDDLEINTFTLRGAKALINELRKLPAEGCALHFVVFDNWGRNVPAVWVEARACSSSSPPARCWPL